MDKWLLTGAGLLFILECAFFATDLNLIGTTSTPSDGLKPVGQVVQTFQNVKRKNQNSLIWENSQDRDQLFENDAVLTLKNSSTKLHLEGDITLDIRQNTLVVLEPRNNDQRRDLLLKFSRGHLRGRSGGQQFKLGHGEWTFNAAPGSDISLRAVNDEEVELEVTKGEVKLAHPTQAEKAVSEGQRLQIKAEEVGEVQSLNTALKWTPRDELKVYAHQFPTPVELQWQGPAESLLLQKENETAKEFKLESSGRFQTALDAGNYFVYLKNAQGSSPQLTLQVLPAPNFIYLSPLPRDRLKTHSPMEFYWMKSPNISSYQLQMSSERSFDKPTSIEASASGVPYRFKEEGEFYWRVQGVDPDGFIIPAPYVYPIYSLERPLQAPKLMSPSVEPRLPAAEETPDQSRKSTKELLRYAFNLIFPQVHAQELQRKIIFNWYPVPDAEFYVIEISSQADFINPEIITQSKTSRFEWTQFSEKTYYFRVAGEQKNGRRGLFSDPLEVDLTRLQKMKPGEIVPGVEYALIEPKPTAMEKKSAPAKESAEEKTAEQNQTPPEPPAPAEPVKKAAETPAKKADLNFQASLYAGGGYLYSKAKAEDFSSNISNLYQAYTAARLNFPLGRKGSLKFHGSYSPLTWKPKNPNSFQSEHKETLWKSSLLYRSHGSFWGYGVGYQNWGYLEREGNESLEMKFKASPGLALFAQGQITESWSNHHEAFLVFWGNENIYQINNHFNYEFAGSHLSIGPRVDISLVKSKPNFSRFQYELGVLFGIHW